MGLRAVLLHSLCVGLLEMHRSECCNLLRENGKGQGYAEAGGRGCGDDGAGRKGETNGGECSCESEPRGIDCVGIKAGNRGGL